MTQFRTEKKGGKRRVIPMKGAKAARSRSMTTEEIKELSRIGIKHPGTLTSLGYHIMKPTEEKIAALDKAVKKYGKKETLRKLGELYRLDYNRPELKKRIADDIKYVSGGKRND